MGHPRNSFNPWNPCLLHTGLPYFHQASPVATAEPFPDVGGHFHSLLRHIGSSYVLAYNDLRSPIFQPATAKQHKDFTSGNMRHAPMAAMYYLVGGEATQEAPYQQNLEYLSTHFGILLQQQTHTGQQWEWPVAASLSPQIQGKFRELPYPILKAHFNAAYHKSHHIGLKQGYSPPKPRPHYTGVQNSHPIISQRSAWQHVSKDPTEEFFLEFKDAAQAKRQIILDALSYIPGTMNLYSESATMGKGVE